MLYEVRRNNKSGYIDSKGSIIVAIEADSCLEFRGLGGVLRGQQLGIVTDKAPSSDPAAVFLREDLFPRGGWSRSTKLAELKTQN